MKTKKSRPNLMQFTLSDQSLKILEQFTSKYGTSKSVIIDRALMSLAGQYHRKIVISYELLTEDGSTTTTSTQQNEYSFKSTKKELLDNQEEISEQEAKSIVNHMIAQRERAKKLRDGEI